MARSRLISCCAGLLALTVLAYLPVWDNDFVDFDDEQYITTNPPVTRGITWSGFLWAWTIDRAPYWMPLTWLSFQLDAHCFSARSPEGDSIPCPAAFHGQNLFWHAASTLLLFVVWRRATEREGASFLVAALFALHPMHVESVAWAAERKDVLSVFFGVLSLGAYVCYVEKPNRPRFVLVILAFLLSLMSKPMLISLPFVFLLLDYWPLRRLRLGTITLDETGKYCLAQRSFRQLVVEKTPLFLLAASVAAFTLHSRDHCGSLVPLSSLSLTARLANALTAYGWYVVTTFYPVDLAVLYPHSHENWSPPSALSGAGTLLSITWVSWRQAARRPWLIVGWLWFVVALLPVSGFAQGGRQAWADRFSYWPHIGFFIAIVRELSEQIKRLHVPALVFRLIGAAALAWLAVLTWRQVGCWRDSFTLWRHAVALTKENDHAHEHLARYYHYRGQRKEFDYHQAEALRIQMQRFQRSRS